MSIEDIIQTHKKLSKIISNYEYFSKTYKDFYIINHYHTYDCVYYADITDNENINFYIEDKNYTLALELYIKDKKTKTKIINYDKYFHILDLYKPYENHVSVNDYVTYVSKVRNKNKALKEIEISIVKFLSSQKHFSNLKIVLSDDAKKQDRIQDFVKNLIFI